MKTEVLKITGEKEHDRKVIAKAAEIIRNGGIVAIPTETVYGLAGSALLPGSAEKIYKAKGRPSDNPLIVHISEPREAEDIAYTSDMFYRLAERFMPGPLTVVLPKKDCIPGSVTGGLDSVAVRCPENPIARALIKASGHPLAAPSANKSGMPSPTTAAHVYHDMNGIIEMIIDGGECSIGVESTVVKPTEDGVMILRPGRISDRMLRKVAGSVEVAASVKDPSKAEKEKVESPGMKYRHYSPEAEVVLIDAPSRKYLAYVRNHMENGSGALVTTEHMNDLDEVPEGFTVFDAGKTRSASERSKRIFSILRRADELGLKTVYAQLPPSNGAFLALYNRIVRAAGGRILKI